jgi:Rrf2 family nitric oxide-sensitive transcriptional repressor
VKGARGRTGGLSLLVAADQLRMGQLVRALETDTKLVACLGVGTSASCIFGGVCGLTGALRGPWKRSSRSWIG